MTVGKVKRQSSRNSRINLSHALQGNKTKATSNHTATQKHTAAKSIHYTRRASKFLNWEKSKDNRAVARESIKLRRKRLHDQNNKPSHMTYYIEIRKSRRRKRWAKFLGERRYWKKEHRKLNSERAKKDADKTVHKRATRVIMGIR